MANKLQIMRGLKSKISSKILSLAEPYFCTDTRELYMGTGSGNVNMGGSMWYKGTAMSGTVTTTGYYSYSACPQVKVGDTYLNTSNGNVYECTTAGSGTTAKWTYKGCIKGAQGNQGNQGNNGSDGKGISSTSVTYQSGTSATTAPTGTWSSSVPSVAAGNYLWTKTVITYTDNTTSTSYSVARQGKDGSDATVTIDSSISDTSTNPVQNKVVKTAIDNKANIEKASSSVFDKIKSGLAIGGTIVMGYKASSGYGTEGNGLLAVGSELILNAYSAAAIIASKYATVSGDCSAIIAAIYGSDSDTDRTQITGAKYSAIVGGRGNKISGSSVQSSIIIGGYLNEIAASNAIVINGRKNKALAYQTKMGHNATDGTAGASTGTSGDALIIGNGTDATQSNAFRITYAGGVYGKAAYNSTGADYAEMFEWEDGNPEGEDRRGLFAYVVGDKIRLATTADTDRRRMGIISAFPAIVGDNFDEDWCGKYLTDIYGAPLTQTVHYDAEYEDKEITDPETGETKTEKVLIHEACDAEEWILNPDYDPDKEYIPRAQRKEYAYWSFIGKLVVRDDGTCVEGGYCYPSKDGVATACTDPDKGYYVMERLDDNHVRVLVR